MKDRGRKPAHGAKIDHALKALFDGVAAQPVPQRFLDLVERLERESRQRAEVCAG